MTKKKSKVGTLLAVTLATAAPAYADATPDPWAATPPVTAFPQNMPEAFRQLQAEAIVDGVLATLGITSPRQLPNGAPACGNVQSKMPTRCDEPVRTASTERR